jgi:RNA polymerase sigma-70 factor (sigma-E family)
VREDFQAFVEVRYTALLRTAFLLTGSSYAAEDLVQSALLRAMRRWERIDDPMAYLRRVMVNQRTNLWRRVTSREVLLADLTSRRDRVSDETSTLAQRDELLTALAALPVRMRAVLVLRYWEDLSEAETADLLGCSAGSVKSQASRGLARLREVLRESHSAPPVAGLATPIAGRN